MSTFLFAAILSVFLPNLLIFHLLFRSQRAHLASAEAHKSQRREQSLGSARVVKRKWLYSFFFVPVVT